MTTTEDEIREAARTREREIADVNDRLEQDSTAPTPARSDEGPSASEVLARAYAQAAEEPAVSKRAQQPDAQMFLYRAEALRSELPDFDEVINRSVFTPMMQDLIFDLQKGPEVAYLLGENSPAAMWLGELPPDQLRAKLEELSPMAPYILDDAKTQRVAAIPDAERSDDTCSMEEYMRRDAQRRIAKMPWERS